MSKEKLTKSIEELYIEKAELHTFVTNQRNDYEGYKKIKEQKQREIEELEEIY